MDTFRELLAAGRCAFGVWLSVSDSLAAEVIGRAGYDCAILDAQHGGVSWDRMLGLIQALDLAGTRALVRVSAVDQAQIMRALDLGAVGVIVPMVSEEAQARLAAEATRYPPQGVRSFGRVRNYYAGETDASTPLCFVMIETIEAIDNLDAIASVPGVDGLFVGPVDLAISLGVQAPLQMGGDVLQAIDKVVAACRLRQKISASASLGLASAQVLMERGVQFIAQGSDMAFLRQCAAAELKALHAWRRQRNDKAP